MLVRTYAATSMTTMPGSLASRRGFVQTSTGASGEGICSPQATKRNAALHLGDVWPLSLWEVSSG